MGGVRLGGAGRAERELERQAWRLVGRVHMAAKSHEAKERLLCPKNLTCPTEVGGADPGFAQPWTVPMETTTLHHPEPSLGLRMLEYHLSPDRDLCRVWEWG